MADTAPLPGWPRCLGRAGAALYVGVSVTTFDAEVRAGMWPPGLRRGAKGGRLTWDRALLDAALDRLAGLQAAAMPAAAAFDDDANLEAQIHAAFGKPGLERHPKKAA